MPHAHASGFPSPAFMPAQSNARVWHLRGPALREHRDQEVSPTVLHRIMKHPKLKKIEENLTLI